MSQSKVGAIPSSYRIALAVYAAIFYLILYGPLVMIAVLSFNRSNIIGFPIRGFGLTWYEKVFRTPEFIGAFGNSIAVGVLAALIATILALCLALGFRRTFPFKTFVFNLVLIPIVMPGIVGGIVLLLFFGYLDLRPSLWTTVLVAHINWVLPFAFLALYPRLHNFDRSLEEAAMDLGARSFGVFWHVVFPIIRPGLIATFLFSFSLSFDEFIRTLFVTGYDRTVPVLFWSRIVDELSPELPAMAVLIILVSATTSLFGVLASRQAARTSQGQA
jgi:ABC-type spermidine/putrescine transport system permease subunit II